MFPRRRTAELLVHETHSVRDRVEPNLRILGAIRASRAATSQVLSWLDALGAAILLAGGLFLSTRERRAQLQYGRYVRCSSAYTVAITPSSLPRNGRNHWDAADGLRNHFARVLEAKVVDVNFFCEYTRRTIKLWRRRGAFALEVDAADARTKLHLETKKTGKRDRKARFKFDESQRLIEEDAQREKGRVVACYVTFETEKIEPSAWRRTLPGRSASAAICGSVGVVCAVKRPPSRAI